MSPVEVRTRQEAELAVRLVRALAEQHVAQYRALSRDYWRLSDEAAAELATARALIVAAEQLKAVAASLPEPTPVPLRPVGVHARQAAASNLEAVRDVA